MNSLNVVHRFKGQNDIIDYHSHPVYEIYFFHSGNCRYLIHNQIYDLEPGDIILMNGLTLHRPNVFPGEEYVRSVIHFSPQIVQDLLKTMNCEYLLHIFERLPHRFIRTKENGLSKELEVIIKKIVEVIRLNVDHDQTKEALLKTLLIQALIVVYKLSNMKHLDFTKEKIFQHEYVESAATYIQENHMKRLTLDSIAEALNLSKSYISRLFKETTGLTVMEYVMECRLNQSKYLLEMEPDMPIKDIAYTSGFESASHFSRYFRVNVGKTAREYRKDRLNTHGSK